MALDVKLCFIFGLLGLCFGFMDLTIINMIKIWFWVLLLCLG
jgi:hypothetical protein